MMNDPKWLRAPSLLAALSGSRLRRGRGHCQGKLRKLLGHGVRGIASPREGRPTTLAEHIEAWSNWCAGRSLRIQRRIVEFVFAASYV